MLKDIWVAYRNACLQNPDWLVKCYVGVCFIAGGAAGAAVHFKQKADILQDICNEQRTVIELQDWLIKKYKQG